VTVARDAAGPAAALRAFASQVHPVFMLPPLAASVFGAVLAAGTVPALGGSFAPAVAGVHVVATFFAVYTAHVKDGYVDFHWREEDDDHPLTVFGCRAGLVGAAVGFLAALAGVATLGGPLAAALTLSTWIIGYLHAPQLDTNPVTATGGYPAGIALAILGGFAAQTGTLAATPLAFAGVFLVVLTGVKVIDDAKDYDYDRSIDKRTVAVTLGRRRARRFAYALMGVGVFGVVAFTVDGLFPRFAPAGAAAFAVVAALATGREPKTATMLLVRGAYLLLAGLLLAVFFRPLAGVPLPDITVLGGYTYLATEILFGSVAVALLVRAAALRRALATVAAVYPVAYLWDWYTLTVGVFSIPMRTGVELLGIPLEEHLFMLVVPGFVLAVHETVHGREGRERTHADTTQSSQPARPDSESGREPAESDPSAGGDRPTGSD